MASKNGTHTESHAIRARNLAALQSGGRRGVSIRPEFADQLAAFVADRDPFEPIFKLPYRTNSARMLRGDLEAAGIAYKDDAGRVADFHALRHTFSYPISHTAAWRPRWRWTWHVIPTFEP